jgi:hypothetical protein
MVLPSTIRWVQAPLNGLLFENRNFLAIARPSNFIAIKRFPQTELARFGPRQLPHFEHT